jgi:glycine oxidase
MNDKGADVLIIGGGLVGLSTALACAAQGLRVHVLHRTRPGTASFAGAGMLAPSIEPNSGAAQQFAIAARDRYPSYLAWLASRGAPVVPLNRRGILDLALDAQEVPGKRGRMPSAAEWLDADAVAKLDPGYAGALGAVLHPKDGAVDNVGLWDALWATAEEDPRVRLIDEQVVAVVREAGGVRARGRSGDMYEGLRLVLAAGAWAAELEGMPRALPVSPLRGQMIAYASAPVRYVAYGAGGYAVPRANGETWVGATMEQVGFAPGTTPAGAAQLTGAAKRMVPDLRGHEPVRHWSGFRPVTPDMLPIIGADPKDPRVIYACGHSRNGILMAPLTGDCVSALITGSPVGVDLTPFSVMRFANR